MSQPPFAHNCQACQVLDAADGVEDGQLHRSIAPHVGHERHIFNSFIRFQDRVADGITAFAGSLNFVYLHSVWFGFWVLLNLGLLGASLKFDGYPFGLLTMIVSLEAIFLSTFVMVSQNRQAARSDIRSEIDFENNVRGEVWAMHIGEKLGVDATHVESVVLKIIDAYRAEAGLGDLPTVAGPSSAATPPAG
jgi:uncharacterized membrane protein